MLLKNTCSVLLCILINNKLTYWSCIWYIKSGEKKLDTNFHIVSAGAKKFTNYVFCHPQFSGVIQNIENCCAIRAKFWKFDFWLYKIDYFDNNRHRQTGVKMAQRFSIFWITPLNCGWQNT